MPSNSVLLYEDEVKGPIVAKTCGGTLGHPPPFQRYSRPRR
ncbi:hypothetical protein [Candidatus Nitrosocosmicus sp. SS]|nr:hypothetical protein [Candidatus Nitrosocosmicus sp. SS]